MAESVEYMNCALAEFYKTDSGLTGLKYDGKDYGRVTVMRLLPFRYDEEYLSVRTQHGERAGKDKEIGLLRAISGLSEPQREIVRDELKRRYFMPEVLKVLNVTEEYGHSTWTVETDAGRREFTVNDMAANLLRLDGNRVILTDLFGCRYLFKDITKMGEKTMRIVEIWL